MRLIQILVLSMSLCSAAAGALPVPADSLAPGIAASDSLPVFATPLDSLVATFADSLAAAGLDSLQLAVGDSTLPPDLSTPPELPLGSRSVGLAELEATRAESLEDVVERLDEALVLVAGDRGMDAYLALDPFTGPGPEIFVDGVPSHSPGDRDPGLWDSSAAPVARVESTVGEGAGRAGENAILLTRREAEMGRTMLRSQFSSTAEETYHRAVSVTTPRGARELRLEFEEFKTEEGIDYSLAPGVSSSILRGRVKVRRFDLGARVATGAGRVSFDFGRGRRLHRGNLNGPESHERWTGRWSLGLDRIGERRRVTTKLYHVDAHDDDVAFGDRYDGARLGLSTSLDPRPEDGGWFAFASVERWSARYARGDSVVSAPRAPRVTRGHVGWRNATDSPWTWEASVEGVDADHAGSAGLGGAAKLRRGGTHAGAELLLERRLRVPTLAESAGRYGFETLGTDGAAFFYDGSRRDWVGGGELALERKDRLSWRGDLRWTGGGGDLSVDRWRLREGIGWEADGDDLAQVVGGIDLDATEAALSLRQVVVAFGSRWRLEAIGRALVSELETSGGRGGGWPKWMGRVRAGWDREFFSPRNRVGISTELHAIGPRQDVVLAALTETELSSVWFADARLWLRVRDAELSFAVDNFLDREIEETVGSFRRPRQWRWMLSWPFTN